jgi:hypothetical protein
VPVRHPPAGEFVDDDHLVLVNEVVLVAVEAVVGVQPPLELHVETHAPADVYRL